MSVRTEFEIRFIFDATKPMPVRERNILLDTLGKLAELRSAHGFLAGDITKIEQALRALPVIEGACPEEVETRRALRETGSVAGAAKQLGLGREAIYSRMRKYNIKKDYALEGGAA